MQWTKHRRKKEETGENILNPNHKYNLNTHNPKLFYEKLISFFLKKTKKQKQIQSIHVLFMRKNMKTDQQHNLNISIIGWIYHIYL